VPGPRANDPRIARTVVDGQELLLPSDEVWQEILATDDLDGRRVGVGRLPAQFRELARTVDGLAVALGADPTEGKPWWVYHVVEIDGAWHRVQVERQKHACGWEGITGNHRVMAIYLGTDDPLARMQAHWDARQAPCPRCGEPLSKPAIWTTPLTDDGG
jgi:hypothetical protein